jgi:hypothetical protein
MNSGTLIYEDKYPDRRITKAFSDFYPNSQLMLKDDQITDSVLKLVEYYQECYRDRITFEFSGFQPTNHQFDLLDPISCIESYWFFSLWKFKSATNYSE